MKEQNAPMCVDTNGAFPGMQMGFRLCLRPGTTEYTEELLQHQVLKSFNRTGWVRSVLKPVAAKKEMEKGREK